MSSSSGSCKLASLLLLLMLSPAIAHAQTQTLFFQPPSYPSCIGTSQVVADFNRDGKLDLACPDGTVLLGNGDGTFRTSTPLSASGEFIAAADFNGDGKIDLLFTGNFAAVYVFLGNGDGTFQPATVTLTGTAIFYPAVADVNGDGKPDVLGLSNNPSVLFEFLGRGDGTFAGAVQIPVGSFNPFGPMTSGDFNGDGKADVVVSGSVNSGYGLGVLLGNGDGTFKPPVVTPLQQPLNVEIATGDFNRDGKLDLLIGSYGVSSSETSLLLGNGDGSFQPPLLVAPYDGNVGVADFNGDGNLDLAIAASFEAIFLGNGNGTFTSGDSYLGGTLLSVPGDFNGDGKPDLATGNSVLLGNGDGTFQGNPAVIAGGYVLFAGVTGDFNGDGIPDIAVTNGSIPINGVLGTSVYVLLGDGTGKFLVTNSYDLSLPTEAIATSDLNGDGKLDLVVISGGNNGNPWTLNVLLGNGDGSFGSPLSFAQGVPINDNAQIVIADFNGDHKPDLAVLSNGELAIFIGNGDGTFASPVSYFAGSGPSLLVAADFNNDGSVDVAVSSSAGLVILIGKGDGTFQPATFSGQTCGVSAVADLNGDGNADLVCDGGSTVLFGKGDGTFGNAMPTGAFGGDAVVVADVNGDGKLDLVNTLQSHSAEALLGNGDGTFGGPIPVTPPFLYAAFLLAADFNRDGKPDLAVNLSGGVVTFLNVSQPGFTLSASALSPPTVTAGGSASSTVTAAPTWGFKGSVSLSCGKLPVGANCGFNPVSLVGASGTSALTITTAATTAPGTYPVSVNGASGSLQHSALLSLVVQQAPGFTISAAALSPAPVLPGGSATSTITVATTGGFNAGVTLSCSSITLNGATATTAPPTCSFNPASVPSGAGTSTLTVSTTASSALLTPPAMRRSGLFYALWLPIGGLALIGAAVSSGSRRRKLLGMLLVCLMLSGVLFLAACGGGGSGNGGGSAGTPAGTYTITVKGTAGSVSNTATVTLTVQ
jgi:FG-GAP-like repeat/FG-GAP repeat